MEWNTDELPALTCARDTLLESSRQMHSLSASFISRAPMHLEEEMAEGVKRSFPFIPGALLRKHKAEHSPLFHSGILERGKGKPFVSVRNRCKLAQRIGSVGILNSLKSDWNGLSRTSQRG
ncbi:hypothetical protein AVEN_221870-1 [Araneus ventricosus]|uniref:Uncharacterized protein n=1 Tax=Araneus ventricosus TaxID=182803 RepID=A0A4Y2SRY3_ARAVE|nr:hypothetical protein AVEN_221870-1 [Araneus ventricosus]